MPWKLSWHCCGSLGGLLLLRALPARSAGSSQPGTEGLISLCNVCSQSQDFNYVFPLLAGSQQSHVYSALLCAMLSHACEKVGLLHSGEVGTEAAHPRVCSWSPCFGCLPLSLVADAGLGICMWSLSPRERGCTQPSASGTAAPSRSIPCARLQQLCCCVQPTRVRIQPGTHPHSQQVPGDQPTPLLPSLGAVLPQDSCCFQGWPNPGCGGGGLPGLLHHLDLRGFNVFLPSPCSRCSV